MAQYRALEDCYIDGTLHGEGSIFGVPDEFPFGPHLQPMDDAATQAKSKWEDGENDRMFPTDPAFARTLMQNSEDKDKAAKEPLPRVDRRGSVRGITEQS